MVYIGAFDCLMRFPGDRTDGITDFMRRFREHFDDPTIAIAEVGILVLRNT